MRPLLWLLLVVFVAANLWVSLLSGYTGAKEVVASVTTGSVVIGSAVALWLTRSRSGSRSGSRVS
ncbi:hypothetical protein [Streptomyces sp.]|uniref:hypothetical protein n=1 Tax=Streptomyces sp. TaxID=1931 RepID=UPI002F948AA7